MNKKIYFSDNNKNKKILSNIVSPIREKW